MLKPKNRKKSKSRWVHPQVGTHLSRQPRLNPKHPEPHPIGERRGTGKPFIRTPINTSIQYMLSSKPGAKVLTHHITEQAKAIMLQEADTHIREWLGLAEDDYLHIVKVCHQFTHDIPTLKVLP